jgi:hypothetical protein
MTIDYAIGASFHKANRSLLRVVPLKSPCRYFATRDSAGFITLPTLDPGYAYTELQGVSQAGFQVDNNEKEFRLFGDDGWSDSVTVGSRVRSSMQTYFRKNVEVPAGQACPEFRGDYSEDYAIIERSRYDTDYEIYFELLKEMGRVNGDSGDYIYDFAGFNGVARNYKESPTPEDLTMVTFDVMSRGRGIFGRYNSGSTPIPIGEIQSTLLFTFPASANTGTRRYATVPAADANGVSVSAAITVTYTDGTDPLAQLRLGQPDGSGFRLEVGSTGIRVPCTVTLGGGGNNVVTITPQANLGSGTIFHLIVRDGAITQAIDGSGSPNANGVLKPLQGFSRLFRTA